MKTKVGKKFLYFLLISNVRHLLSLLPVCTEISTCIKFYLDDYGIPAHDPTNRVQGRHYHILEGTEPANQGPRMIWNEKQNEIVGGETELQSNVFLTIEYSADFPRREKLLEHWGSKGHHYRKDKELLKSEGMKI